VVDELERGNLLGRLLDSLTKLRVCMALAEWPRTDWGWHTQPELHVDCCCRALEDTKGAHNRRRHAVLGLVYPEVLQRALRLGTPVLVGRHLDLAKGIALGSCVGHTARDAELAALERGLCL